MFTRQNMKLLLLTKFNSQNYIDAVLSFGHEVLLECDDLSEIDGLILCGGSDVHPRYYGEEIDGAVGIDEERDEREVPITLECIRRGIPILGICRGQQLLNAVLGGTLIQHLPNVEYHNKKGSDRYITHEVRAERGSVFDRLFGETFTTNTSHHQAIGRLAVGLRATLCSTDGVIEGVEHETLPIIAVQWHPERMMLSFASDEMADGRRIFEYFFSMIEKRMLGEGIC